MDLGGLDRLITRRSRDISLIVPDISLNVPKRMQVSPDLRISARAIRSWGERLARASASPTRSDPEGSSRNEPRLGRVQPLTQLKAIGGFMVTQVSLRAQNV